MSDLFFDEVTDSYRDQIVDVIEDTPQHQYQVLTKRADALVSYSRRRKLPSNFWAGVTIESMNVSDRLDALKQVDAEIRFVSCEPLLSSLSLDWSGINWVITGGESGRHLLDPKKRELRSLAKIKNGHWEPREDRIDWVREIRDDVKNFGAAFFHKQWGGTTGLMAGRELDGRTWDEFPRLPTTGRANKELGQAVLFANG
jgi:protein gp37